MTGGYLEQQITGYIIGPIVAFRNYIFPNVLPAFGNLDKRAEGVASEYYRRVGSQPAYDDEDIDMASVAEAAQDQSISWYQMMVSLRQSMLNLLAAGLFHLTEQKLAMLCRDGGFIAQWLDNIRALWPECPTRISSDGQSILVRHAPAVLPAESVNSR